MLSIFKQLFGSADEPKAASETPEDHDERLRIATCVVMLEIARADDEFTDDERQHIVATLQNRFELSEDDANELIAAATTSREESIDLWSFTNQINQNSSGAEKIEIIEEIWRVIFADGTLDGHEDMLVHRLAKLLNLTHKELMEAKLRVREEQRGQA